MPRIINNIDTILVEAVEITSPTDRAAFVAKACGGDSVLQRHVEEMVENHFEAGDFLQHAVSIDAPTHITDESAAPVGTMIGPYKLGEVLGEGGMGVVYRAEQKVPVRRLVALKVIKPGMDTQQVVARFEVERQALAIMNHPNIAKVLDAGATDAGRPYFVMDLVKGAPLTDFCDQQKLNTRERLQLFVTVCQAIQHAHQKGVIHRDIKPSNVLVEIHDVRPVPKVIDFGVAKAIGHQLTEKTLHTGFDQMVGTPLYMSPEQAGQSSIDVDTRSDVYSLGVLLYEILTGHTPFEQETLRNAGFDEMRRMIREVDPPRPSARVSTLEAKALSTVSDCRKVEPRILSQQLRGELDWIVMKALEKDRNRRYESATGLAADVQRYLDDEPVHACPPSRWYRFQKVLRKNKGPVIAVSLVFVALLAGIIGTTIGLVDAQRERKKAEQAESATLAAYRASTDDAIEQLIGSKPELGPHEKSYLEITATRWQTFADRPGDDERSQTIRGEGRHRVAKLWQNLGRNEEARTGYRTAVDIRQKLVEQFPDVQQYRQDLANSHNNLAIVLRTLGKPEESHAEYDAALVIQKNLVEQFPAVHAYREKLANSHGNLGILLQDGGKFDAASAEYQAALDIREKLVEQSPTEPVYRQHLANDHNSLGNLLKERGQFEEARAKFQTASEILKRLVDQFPIIPVYQQELAHSRGNLGIVLGLLEKPEEALAEHQVAHDILKQLVQQFPIVRDYQESLVRNHTSLGKLLAGFGKNDEALAKYKAALDLQKILVEQFPAVPAYQQERARAHLALGQLLAGLGKNDEALSEFNAALELQKKLVEQLPDLPRYQRDLVTTHHSRGQLLAGLGKNDEALSEFNAALELQKKLVEQLPDLPDYQSALASTHDRLGGHLKVLGKLEDALVQLRTASDIRKKVVEQFPGVPAYQQELASTHDTLGGLLRGLGEVEKARAEYQAAIDIQKKVVEQFPAVPVYKILLGASFCNYGNMIFNEGKPAESLEWFDLAIHTLQPVYEKDTRVVSARHFLRNSHHGRASAYDKLQKPAEAAKSWDRVFELSLPAEQPGFLAAQATSRINAGMVAEAVADVAELTKNPNWKAGQWYNFACVYSLASGKIADKQQEYADRAMELLTTAVAAGWSKADLMAKDTDLAPLRDREDFKRLVASLLTPVPNSGDPTATLPNANSPAQP